MLASHCPEVAAVDGPAATDEGVSLNMEQVSSAQLDRAESAGTSQSYAEQNSQLGLAGAQLAWQPHGYWIASSCFSKLGHM